MNGDHVGAGADVRVEGVLGVQGTAARDEGDAALRSVSQCRVGEVHFGGVGPGEDDGLMDDGAQDLLSRSPSRDTWAMDS